MKQSKIKLKDIADNLGLSIGTVQRALNNKGGYSQRTQKLVLEEARNLGYITNPAASALRRNPLKIAIVLPPKSGSKRYYFPDIWKGILKAEEDLAIYNISLIKYETENGKEELEHLLDSEEVLGGLITRTFVEPEYGELMSRFKEKQIPVFSVDGSSKENIASCNFAISSMNLGCLSADIFHSIFGEKEGTIILLSGNKRQERQMTRASAFCTAMSELCPNINVIEIHMFQDDEKSRALLMQTLSDIRNIVGIYAVTAVETLTMCDTLRAMNLSRKITAIGTDVFLNIIPYFNDGTLTASIYQYPVQRGYLALKLLVSSILNPAEPVAEQVIPISAVFRSTAEGYCKIESQIL